MKNRIFVVIAFALFVAAVLWLVPNEPAGDSADSRSSSSRPSGDERRVAGTHSDRDTPGSAHRSNAPKPGQKPSSAPSQNAKDSAQKASEEAKNAGSNAASSPTANTTAGDPDAPPKRPDKKWPLDRDGIQGAIKAAKPEMKHCYEQWLKMNPSLGGRIVVRFTIDKNPDKPEEATVTDIGLKDTELKHEFMEGCVMNAISGTRFDLPAGGGKMNVNYPLVFSSPDAGIHDAGF